MKIIHHFLVNSFIIKTENGPKYCYGTIRAHQNKMWKKFIFAFKLKQIIYSLWPFHSIINNSDFFLLLLRRRRRRGGKNI